MVNIGGLYSFFSGFLACAGNVLFVGLKHDPLTEAHAWPITAMSVSGDDLATVSTKEDYIAEWNADAANQAVGTLAGTYGPFGFEIRLKCDVDISVLNAIFTVPPQVIGTVIVTTTNGGSASFSGTVKLADFIVGATGAPMADGDVDYVNAALINRTLAVFVSGMIIPIDTTGTGAGQDPNGRWGQIVPGSNTLTIVNGVFQNENVQVYVLS